MRLADLFLVAALVCLSLAVAHLSVPGGLLVAAVGFVCLWWLLDEEVPT